MIEVKGLSVRFGGVTSIDDVSITFPVGTCGLIGPNGAGKTTFFNVLSGFVTPQAGEVVAFGEDLLAMPAHKRARWGLRRTFQTDQTIESLSLYDNVMIVYEHTGGDRRGRRQAVTEALEFTGLAASASDPVGVLSAGERRLVELARAVVGQPRLILLDEPAAGLPEEETGHLAELIQSVPEATGATVILVDHDMSLVQACCTATTVLDFGRVLASGPTGEVLRDNRVTAAYLGTFDLEVTG